MGEKVGHRVLDLLVRRRLVAPLRPGDERHEHGRDARRDQVVEAARQEALLARVVAVEDEGEGKGRPALLEAGGNVHPHRHAGARAGRALDDVLLDPPTALRRDLGEVVGRPPGGHGEGRLLRGEGTDRPGRRGGDAPGVPGVGEPVLEVAHEVVADAGVGLERRLVPEEVGPGNARHRVLATVADHVPGDADVVRLPAVEEDDAVGPLDERARGQRGEESVDGGGLVRGRAQLRRGSREAGRHRDTRRRGRPDPRVRRGLGLAPVDARELALAAREEGAVGEARRRPHEVVEEVEARALLPALGAGRSDVEGLLLREDHEVVPHEQRETRPRARASASAPRRSPRRRR